jgi:hypothetical protein
MAAGFIAFGPVVNQHTMLGAVAEEVLTSWQPGSREKEKAES